MQQRRRCNMAALWMIVACLVYVQDRILVTKAETTSIADLTTTDATSEKSPVQTVGETTRDTQLSEFTNATTRPRTETAKTEAETEIPTGTTITNTADVATATQTEAKATASGLTNASSVEMAIIKTEITTHAEVIIGSKTVFTNGTALRKTTPAKRGNGTTRAALRVEENPVPTTTKAKTPRIMDTETASEDENTTAADTRTVDLITAKNSETTDQTEVKTTISTSSLTSIETAQTEHQAYTSTSNTMASQYDPEVTKAAKIETSATTPVATHVETTNEQIMATGTINEASTDQTKFSNSNSVKKTPITEATMGLTGTQSTIETLSIANTRTANETQVKITTNEEVKNREILITTATSTDFNKATNDIEVTSDSATSNDFSVETREEDTIEAEINRSTEIPPEVPSIFTTKQCKMISTIQTTIPSTMQTETTEITTGTVMQNTTDKETNDTEITGPTSIASSTEISNQNEMTFSDQPTIHIPIDTDTANIEDTTSETEITRTEIEETAETEIISSTEIPVPVSKATTEQYEIKCTIETTISTATDMATTNEAPLPNGSETKINKTTEMNETDIDRSTEILSISNISPTMQYEVKSTTGTTKPSTTQIETMNKTAFVDGIDIDRTTIKEVIEADINSSTEIPPVSNLMTSKQYEMKSTVGTTMPSATHTETTEITSFRSGTQMQKTSTAQMGETEIPTSTEIPPVPDLMTSKQYEMKSTVGITMPNATEKETTGKTAFVNITEMGRTTIKEINETAVHSATEIPVVPKIATSKQYELKSTVWTTIPSTPPVETTKTTTFPDATETQSAASTETNETEITRSNENYEMSVISNKQTTYEILMKSTANFVIHSTTDADTTIETTDIRKVTDAKTADRRELVTFASTRRATLEYISIKPTFGPAAGGTAVTIVENWTSKNVSISAVYIGQMRLATESDGYGEGATERTISLKTLSISDMSVVNQPLPIVLEILPDSVNVTTGVYFTYKPNPRVNDVSPRKLPISGGIRLNVSGNNLDSVSDPLIRAVVKIWNENRTVYVNESFAPCYPPTHNGTQMVCLSPVIYVRNDYLVLFYSLEDPYSNSYHRRRRYSSRSVVRERRASLNIQEGVALRSKRSTSILTNQTYTLTYNSAAKMIIGIGIAFDGFGKYEEDALKDSSGGFNLCTPPSISYKALIRFDPHKDTTITIEGADLAACGSVLDYTVRIGDGFCDATDLTDNALTCRPPQERPRMTETDRMLCGDDDRFAVLVEFGYKKYKSSCLSYSDDETKIFIVIVVVASVGSSVVLFVVIVTMSIFIRRRRRRRIKGTSEKPEPQECTVNSLTKKRDTMDNSSRKNFLHSLSVDGGSYRDRSYNGCEGGSPFEGDCDQNDCIDSLPCCGDSYNLSQLPAEAYLSTIDEEYTNAAEMGSEKFSGEGGIDPGW